MTKKIAKKSANKKLVKKAKKYKYIVMATDIADSADCEPHQYATCDSKKEAIDYIKADMHDYIDNWTFKDEDTGKIIKPKVDWKKYKVESNGHEASCTWTIVPVEV